MPRKTEVTEKQYLKYLRTLGEDVPGGNSVNKIQVDRITVGLRLDRSVFKSGQNEIKIYGGQQIPDQTMNKKLDIKPTIVKYFER